MTANRRILIVDDNEAIHADFRKVLAPRPGGDEALDQLEASLFGGPADSKALVPAAQYQLSFASQGQDALALVEKAETEGKPYAVIFMDVRMPPGWDGVETTKKIWQKFPNVEVVICTAYSDYSSDQILAQLGVTDRLLFLKKPFEPVVVQQLALTLTTKWELGRQNRARIESLTDLVAERNRQLEATVESLRKTNVDLEESLRRQNETQQMLLQASKLTALGEMAGGIAHEVNNPLATIRLTAEQMEMLLEDNPIDANLMTTRVQMILKTVTRISTTIQNMLSFARSSDSAPMEPTRASELLNNTFVFCVERFRRQQTELKSEPVPPGAVFLGRGSQVSQVLLNLLNNACDAVAQQSERWVKVETKVTNEWVELHVSNSGPPIPPEVRARIFKPFFTTKEAGKGTGLGLSISQKILSAHGGELILLDSPHTTFVARLPRLVEPARGEAEKAA